MIAILILVGLVVWYVVFGAENLINGSMENDWKMPFRFLWQDMTSGECPYGLIHSLIMHIFVPVAPLLLWSILK